MLLKGHRARRTICYLEFVANFIHKNANNDIVCCKKNMQTKCAARMQLKQ
jgi:hypothetical protein